jgi:hypothetical protein
MCDKESFARLKDQTEENTKQINELAKRDAEQSVQIKDLAKTTEKQGDSLLRLVNRLVAAIIGILVITVLAVIFGALGKDGFNAVTKAAPTALQEAAK